MSKIYQCDRCHKIIDRPFCYGTYVVRQRNGCANVTSRTFTHPSDTFNDLDLCEECSDELYKFMTCKNEETKNDT